MQQPRPYPWILCALALWLLMQLQGGCRRKVTWGTRQDVMRELRDSVAAYANANPTNRQADGVALARSFNAFCRDSATDGVFFSTETVVSVMGTADYEARRDEDRTVCMYYVSESGDSYEVVLVFEFRNRRLARVYTTHAVE